MVGGGNPPLSHFCPFGCRLNEAFLSLSHSSLLRDMHSVAIEIFVFPRLVCTWYLARVGQASLTHARNGRLLLNGSPNKCEKYKQKIEKGEKIRLFTVKKELAFG